MAKSLCQMTEVLDKLLPISGDVTKEARAKLIDSTTLLGQAMIKNYTFEEKIHGK